MNSRGLGKRETILSGEEKPKRPFIRRISFQLVAKRCAFPREGKEKEQINSRPGYEAGKVKGKNVWHEIVKHFSHLYSCLADEGMRDAFYQFVLIRI